MWRDTRSWGDGTDERDKGDSPSIPDTLNRCPPNRLFLSKATAPFPPSSSFSLLTLPGTVTPERQTEVVLAPPYHVEREGPEEGTLHGCDRISPPRPPFTAIVIHTPYALTAPPAPHHRLAIHAALTILSAHLMAAFISDASTSIGRVNLPSASLTQDSNEIFHICNTDNVIPTNG
ncbi:hypothetical protein E2C01_019801 [Portunus trituberculatus]|uniref:Uncharacterized protein n=1 Tax=Portunus trituberculatus TaxID=210409 RepID=A0A5B7E1F7_PORTR|nr:hypothetical protein [Portunus trituberculatus]